MYSFQRITRLLTARSAVTNNGKLMRLNTLRSELTQSVLSTKWSDPNHIYKFSKWISIITINRTRLWLSNNSYRQHGYYFHFYSLTSRSSFTTFIGTSLISQPSALHWKLVSTLHHIVCLRQSLTTATKVLRLWCLNVVTRSSNRIYRIQCTQSEFRQFFQAGGGKFCFTKYYVSIRQLTIWRPLLPYWYSYNASCARPG